MRRLLTIILLLLFNATTMFSQVGRFTADVNDRVAGNVHVGDVITFPNNSKGVVFYISPDRTTAWVAKSTDTQSSTVSWATGNNANVNTAIADITAYNLLLNDVDGYDNTVKMRAANAYASSSTIIDFEHGWYIPAAGQLRRLYGM